jgi:hypothetical protein
MGRIKHTTSKESLSVESGRQFFSRNLLNPKQLALIADVNYIIAVQNIITQNFFFQVLLQLLQMRAQRLTSLSTLQSSKIG